MGCPEVKILRDALTREIALREKSDARVVDLGRLLGERDGTTEEQAVIMSEQAGMIPDLEKHIGVYENPHTPPSQGQIPGEKRKKEQGKDPAEHKSPGRKKGHKGELHGNKATRGNCTATRPQGLSPHPEKVPQVRLQEDQEDGQNVDKDRPGHTGGVQGGKYRTCHRRVPVQGLRRHDRRKGGSGGHVSV